MRLRLRQRSSESAGVHPPEVARLYDGYGAATWLGYVAAWTGGADAFAIFPLPATGQTLVVARSGEAVEPADAWPVGGTGLVYVLPGVLAPVGAEVWPPLTEAEVDTWTTERTLLWLPGAEPLSLPAPLDLAVCFVPPARDSVVVAAPPPPHRPPLRLGAIVAPAPEVDLEARINAAGSEGAGDELKPLSPGEELKRDALRRLLKGGRLSNFFARRLTDSDDPEGELEALERRSGDDVERLERLFEDDPLAALRHSAPLDTKDSDGRGFGRGSDFRLREYWRRLGIDAPARDSARGGGAMAGDQFARLRELYEAQAGKLRDAGRHEEVAFVYLKLLDDPLRAAQHLRAEGLHAEAADVFLRHAKRPVEAAECYQLARLHTLAIPLFEEALQYTPAGDCARAAGLEARADILYRKAVRAHVARGDIGGADDVLTQKLGDQAAAMTLLDSAWREGKDSKTVIKRYLSRMPDGGAQLAYLEETRSLMNDKKRQLTWMGALAQVKREHPEAGEEVWRAGLAMASAVAKGNRPVLEALARLSEDAHFGREVARGR